MVCDSDDQDVILLDRVKDGIREGIGNIASHCILDPRPGPWVVRNPFYGLVYAVRKTKFQIRIFLKVKYGRFFEVVKGPGMPSIIHRRIRSRISFSPEGPSIDVATPDRTSSRR